MEFMYAMKHVSEAPHEDEHISVASRARGTCQLSTKCPQK